ncbi:MAG: hypothetical protein DMG37_23690 [Acidobacteria bacterium]|nr:MAG: hypothetical protein DMG37_23690 [Acidobacteriota bacterium]
MVGTAQEKRFARLDHRDTSETGLDPTHFRMFASTEGRWLGKDPSRGCVKDPQELNRYAYVRNSPTNHSDRHGNQFGCNPFFDPYCCDSFYDPFCFGFNFYPFGPAICACGIIRPSTIRRLLCSYACICSDGLPDFYAFRCYAGAPLAYKLCPPYVIIFTPGYGRNPTPLYPLPLCGPLGP